MNVAFDPWIPVVTLAGVRKLVSLKQIFTEGKEFSDLTVRPHERVALMRLFLCVAHASLDGPKEYEEWCQVQVRLPDCAEKYLTEWKDSFELFHETKPWLQIKKLEGVAKDDERSTKTSPVALLDFELATGNNSTLFDHFGLMKNRKIELERMVLNLLTFLNFSSGGGAPVAQWEKTKTSQVGNPDAPCLSQSMAHCLFRGRSLAETIHLNMPTHEAVNRTYKSFKTDKKSTTISDLPLGKPVWEYFPDSPLVASDKVVNATRTYIGRLVPISRWVRLIENSDQMYCCNGFRYDTFKDGFASEPTAAVRLNKKKDKNGIELVERKVVKIDPLKALWRELSALLVKRSAFGLGGPLAMENAPWEAEFDFHVCAMTRDQASMDIAVESVFHITPSFSENMPIYQAEVLVAENYSKKLRLAIEKYRSSIDGDWNQRVGRTQPKDQFALKMRLAETAFSSFWTMVEKNLPILFRHIEAIGTNDAIPTRDSWRRMTFSAACKAYKVACGQETPRQIRAFSEGWSKLVSRESSAGSYMADEKEEDEV
ncbi:MAG: type I-E CRISPR-associated protein Cse1/CasA [Desulfobacterales bacterium]|nr:type I-E CRISPR-associated protein Cse1/CasA [Desulfobacterales bacterium]